MLNQYTKSHHTSQQEKSKRFISKQPWYFIKPIPTVAHPLGTILAFHPARTRVLNTIILLCSRYELVYTSQSKIARMANVCLTTANKEIAWLSENGFIAKHWTGYNKSCWYKVSEYFNDIDVRKSLASKLTFFFYFSINLLSSFTGETVRSKNVFNFITLVASLKQPNTTKQLERKEKNQRRILKKKGSMLKQQHEISETIRNLDLNLTFEQQQQLARYSEAELLIAKRRLDVKKDARNRVSLFFWFLRNPEPSVKTKTIQQPTNQSADSAQTLRKVEEKRIPKVVVKSWDEQIEDYQHTVSLIKNNLKSTKADLLYAEATIAKIEELKKQQISSGLSYEDYEKQRVSKLGEEFSKKLDLKPDSLLAKIVLASKPAEVEQPIVEKDVEKKLKELESFLAENPHMSDNHSIKKVLERYRNTQKSNTTTETTTSNINTQSTEKDSTTVKFTTSDEAEKRRRNAFENMEEYEEVYD